MSTTLAHDALKTGIDRVANIVPRRATLPVIQNVLIEPDPESGSLFLTGTDLTTWVRSRVAAVTDGVLQTTTTPAIKLRELSRKLPAGSVALGPSEDRLMIQAGGSRFRLNTISADTFPTTAQLPWESGFDLPAKEIVASASATAEMASTDDTKSPLLRSVLWEIEGEYLTMVATDGARLARIRRFIGRPMPAGRYVVPRGAVDVMTSLLDGAETVRVAMESGRIGFRTADLQIITSLVVDDPYPDYRRVIRTEHDRSFEVDRHDLVGALERMEVVAVDKMHRVSFHLDENRLMLKVQTEDLGDAQEQIPIVYAPKEPFQIDFDAAKLLSVLRYVSAEQLKVSLRRPEEAAILEAVEQAEGMHELFLVLPLRQL